MLDFLQHTAIRSQYLFGFLQIYLISNCELSTQNSLITCCSKYNTSPVVYPAKIGHILTHPVARLDRSKHSWWALRAAILTLGGYNSPESSENILKVALSMCHYMITSIGKHNLNDVKI